MSSELWAPYSDAIKLILTGSTSQTLKSEQKAVYLTMLDQGMVDKRGKKRELPGVRVKNTEVGEREPYYYIPDIFTFMLTVFEEWSIFNPPVHLDYLNNLVDEAGKPLFMLSDAPGHKKWEASESGQNHWKLVTKRMKIKLAIDELQKTHHGNDPLKLEAQKRMFKSLSAKLKRVNQKLQQYGSPAIGIENINNDNDNFAAEPIKGTTEWWQKHGSKAADKRHGQPGGSRDKQKSIRALWATGKYRSREQCANIEAPKLGMSVATARKALTNIPKSKT